MIIDRVVFLFLLFLAVATANIKTEPNYYQYLQQYGYTPKVEGRRLFSMIGKSSYSDAIRTFQRLYKLPETGELDEKTKSYMRRARCGNPDLGTFESIGRPINVDMPTPLASVSGRSAGKTAPLNYAKTSYKWPKTHLKWFIEEYPKKQTKLGSHENIRKILTQAFNDWERHSILKFEMVSSKKAADVKIKFVSSDHSDGYPFDGQGATLAHAFFPTSGDLHFDDDESFTNIYENVDDQYTLRLVAAHEIGHTLGLSHSLEPESLMFPLYQQFSENYKLSNDDQEGIEAIYGKHSTTTTSSRKPEVISTTPAHHHQQDPDSNMLPIDNWCPARFQTGCEGPDGDLYLFRDQQVWRYQARANKHVWDPAPTSISETYKQLNDATITACVKSSKGYTYFFRDFRLWKIKTHWAADGPYTINGKNFPQNPRVALLHRNSIYLIRDKLAYRFYEDDFNRQLEIVRLDSILQPPPHGHIRSGFTYAKQHYLFTEHEIYVYDSSNGRIVSGYPRGRNDGWFACEASQAQKGRKKSTTAKPRTVKASRKSDSHVRRGQDTEEDEDDFHRHHHHHHHHHWRKRPFHHQPPQQYRRRWNDY